MKILAIESYYGGSHKAYIDGWIRHSRHQFDLVTFPAYKWKWRMRHTSLSAGREVYELCNEGKKWDLLFASDMLNLAEFIGLAPAPIATLPRIAYFHENQLTYPDNSGGYRDMHFPYTNFTTAGAADHCWFNTAWHRDEFLTACKEFLKKMPDYRHLAELDTIRENSAIFGQGICQPSQTLVKETLKDSKPLKLTWAARWEHDKNPEDLYELLSLLTASKIDFKINIIGESFNQIPDIFTKIKNKFSNYIDRFGFQPTREDYYRSLLESDILISTAIHEFFGISIVEGCACGAIPVAPKRLAYPEVLQGEEAFLYANTAPELYCKILELNTIRTTKNWKILQQRATELAAPFYWEQLAAKMDNAIEEIVQCHK